MNILPHKSWHVRTKKNIARVRKDEAKAAEEDKVKQDRIKLAEREARTELLRQRARGQVPVNKDFISFSSEGDSLITNSSITSSPTTDSSKTNSSKTDSSKKDFSRTDFSRTHTKNVNASSSGQHVNFFQDLEDGTAELKKSNKEHDEEKKAEQEKYEKQIGYLTYLGQDTHESLGTKSWYSVLPERSKEQGKKSAESSGEVNLKSKNREDPLWVIKKFTAKEGDEKAAVKTVERKTFQKSQETFQKTSQETSQKTFQETFEQESIRQKDKSSQSPSKQKKHKSKKSKHKSRKRKRSTSDERRSSSEESSHEERRKKLEALRKERLKREAEERGRTEALLAKLRGDDDKKEGSEHTSRGPGRETSDKQPSFVKRKYNSQFNPELAKQNYSPPKRNYFSNKR